MNDIQRYDWLDMAKGIGIILVVMGHTLFPIHAAIDVFHMPLFFILAGLTLRETRMDIFLLKKTDSIFVPYVFFSLLSVLFSFLIPHEGIFNGPLWFLQTLFVSLLIVQLILQYRPKVSKGLVPYMGGAMMILIVCSKMMLSNNINHLPFDFDRALRACPFVLTGYLLKDVLLKDYSYRRDIIMLMASIVIYSIAFYTYFQNYHPKGTFKMGDIMQQSILLFYLSSLGGSFAVIEFCRIIRCVEVVNWLGRNSLVIMCVHFPMAEFLNKYISTTSLYNDGGLIVKAGISIVIVTICLCFGSTCAVLCNKYIPSLTSYKRNFNMV